MAPELIEILQEKFVEEKPTFTELRCIETALFVGKNAIF